MKEISLDEIGELSLDEIQLESSYIQEEKKILLHRAMKKLKNEYQQVLWLVYFEEFNHREVAHIMKKTVHSIDTLVYRARKSLKSELEKEGFTYENL